MKVGFISLGCAKNQVNCEQMIWQTYEAGHEVALGAEDCDVAVVNTCGFLQEARDEATHLKQKAESDIEQERRKAYSELVGEISGMAVDIAGRMVEREINADDHKELVDEFIKKAGEAS